MEEYTVTAYYFEDEDDPYKDEPRRYTNQILENTAEGAALWVENHLRSDVGVSLTGNIEVQRSDSDTIDRFPV